MFGKKTLIQKLFDVCNIVFMIFFSLTIIYPYFQQILISISTKADLARMQYSFLPNFITLEAYYIIFNNRLLGIAYLNTIFRVVVGTITSLSFTAIVAYPLSRKYLPDRTFWTGIIVFTMFFSGGLIPNYLLIKNLGLRDNLLVYIIPSLLGAFNIVMIRNFYMALPEELNESARIDGANELQILFRIIVPVSKPVLATVALWTVVGHWNSWFDNMLYVNDPNKQVLQFMLRKLLTEMTPKAFFSEISQLMYENQKQWTPE